MPLKRDWQSRIKAVEREYVAMHQAAVRFQHAALNDPGILEENLKNGEILAASRNLEATYIIRLFAEFESGARQYWSTVRPTNPPVADLIIGLAARRRIPETQQGNAHKVREYRNGLVHEREEETEPVPISTARGHLCHFFSFLPEVW